MGNGRNSNQPELNFEALLINGLQKASPLVLIDLKESTTDGEAFVWIDELGVHLEGMN